METVQQLFRLATDAELITKILAGETSLFEILIRRYNGTLYKIARAYGLNHQDAEDQMQEAHVAAYMQLGQFRQQSSYKTWLTKILLHKCYHKTSYGNLKYEQSDTGLVSQDSESMRPSSFKNETEKAVLNKELAALLEKSIQSLPIQYRSVFVLREMEGYSVAETADLLQITTTNVKVRLNRCKTMLQKELETYYSSSELFDFNLVYCDGIVRRVFDAISKFHM